MIEIPPMLPCPFCGKQPKVEPWTEYIRAWPEFETRDRVLVSCCIVQTDRIENWNNRA